MPKTQEPRNPSVSREEMESKLIETMNRVAAAAERAASQPYLPPYTPSPPPTLTQAIVTYLQSVQLRTEFRYRARMDELRQDRETIMECIKLYDKVIGRVLDIYERKMTHEHDRMHRDQLPKSGKGVQ